MVNNEMKNTGLYPKISVVVPVYNVDKYLRKCINSVLEQTYHNWELLLVDDGSTDLSGIICDEYASKDSRIITLHLKNGGPSKARNAALEIATGEWLTFLDSDDYLSSEGYERMIEAGKDVHMVISGKIIESEKKNRTEVPTDSIITDQYPGSLFLKSLVAKSLDYIWNRFYRMSIIKNYGLHFEENLSTGEDTLFNLDFHRYCKSIRICAYAYYHYVSHYNTLSKGFRPQIIKSHDMMLDRYIKLKLIAGEKEGEFQKYIDARKIHNFHVEIVDYIYNRGVHSIADYTKVKTLFYNRYRKDEIFMDVLRERTDISKIMNHKVNRILLLYFPMDIFILYNMIVGKIK